MQKCGAKTRHGGTCQNPPVTGSKRCRMHGGKSPQGDESARYKHGRYSKYLPKRIAAKMQDFVDADPLDLTEEMSLAKAILADWVGRYDELGLPIDLTGLSAAGDMLDKVKSLALAIQKLRTDTTITPAEVMLFLSRIIEVAGKYVPEQYREAFVAECRAVFGADVSAPIIVGQLADA